MPSLNHVHTYIKLNKQEYKCADPYCSHFTKIERILGKASVCTVCNNEFILPTSKEKMLSKPRCLNCRNDKEAREFRRQQDSIMSILKESGIQEDEIIPTTKDKEDEMQPM